MKLNRPIFRRESVPHCLSVFAIMKVLCCGNCNRPFLPARPRSRLQVRVKFVSDFLARAASCNGAMKHAMLRVFLMNQCSRTSATLLLGVRRYL